MQPEVTPASPVRPFWIALGAVLLGVVLAIIWIIWQRPEKNPVPQSIRSGAGFTVYYPDPKKLPKNYLLDLSSFKTAQAGVVVFSVNRSGGRRIIVSEEKPPAESTIGDFLKSYIPLRTALATRLGQVQVGAFGSPTDLRTVASLVIKKGPWVIITAPSDIPQSDLKQIIEALRK